MRLAALALLLVLLAPLTGAGTGPEARLACPSPTLALPAGPATSATAPTTLLRQDPDGMATLVTTIDDPFGGSYEYVSAADGRRAYLHRWADADRALLTVGLVAAHVRVPIVVLEGEAVAAALARDALDLADLAIDGGASLLVGLAPAPAPGEPPQAAEPQYVWTSYRQVDGRALWTGLARTRQATQDAAEGARASCLRLELLAVVRTEAATTPVGGVFLEASQVHERSAALSASAVGILAGITAGGIDTPSAGTRATRVESADGRGRGEVSLGARDEMGRYHPLVGARQEVVRAEAPEAYRGMTSLGVYRVDGAFVPVVGARTHVERMDPLSWANALVLSGGPGSAEVGDWEADLGAFDAFGRFVPVAGATYDDALAEVGEGVPTGIRARHEAQALVTAGAWAGGSYVPLLGATYDGERPLLAAGPGAATPGDHVVSAGAFAPLAGYVPLVGLAQDAAPGAQDVQVGTFAGSYDDFVPLAQASWRSAMPFAQWWLAAGLTGRAPSDASLEAGPVVAGTFAPVARYEADQGAVDQHHVLVAGVRAAGACRSGEEAGADVAGRALLALRLGALPPSARAGGTCA